MCDSILGSQPCYFMKKLSSFSPLLQNNYIIEALKLILLRLPMVLLLPSVVAAKVLLTYYIFHFTFIQLNKF